MPIIKKKLLTIRTPLYFFIAAAFILTTACNDLPTELGLTLIPDTVSTNTITTDDAQLILEAKSVLVRMPFVHQGFILAGKSHDVTSTVLMRFANFPDTLHYLRDLTTVDSVMLILKPLRYALGDTLAAMPFSFKIHKISKLWRVGFTWDSINTEGGSPAFIDPVPVASFKGKIDLKDTMPNFKVMLDKEFLRQWLDSNNKEVNFGLAIVPDEDCKVIHRFEGSRVNAINQVPYVKMFYKDRFGKDTNHVVTSAYEGTFPDCPPLSADMALVQGLMVYRTVFEFDFSAIPPLSGINKANLEIYLDKASSYYGNNGMDDAIKAGIYENVYELNPVYDPFGYAMEYTGLRDTIHNNKFVFEQITSAVEYIVRKGGKGSFYFTPYEAGNDLFELDRTVLYGSNAADPALRPKLRIFYSNIEKK